MSVKHCFLVYYCVCFGSLVNRLKFLVLINPTGFIVTH